MKKALLTWTLFYFSLLAFPMATLAADVQFLKITVVSAKLWPTKPNGKCWDPCLGKQFKLPPRGNPDYAKYFQDPEFTKACSGTKAPDAYVEIQIGKYGFFSTNKINDSCMPTFNVSKVFRVPSDASFTVTVYDNDGAAGFQAKKDLMGVFTSPQVPKELVNGTLVLKSFNQVEELVLKGEVVKRDLAAGCDGVYEVQLAEFDVHETKESGKPWDRGIGPMKKPDVVTTLKIGSTELSSPKQQDTVFKRFTNIKKTFTIKKGMSLFLGVYDKDAFGRQETIGETAETDVCKIINDSGQHTFTDFGRVKKVVLIFVKMK